VAVPLFVMIPWFLAILTLGPELSHNHSKEITPSAFLEMLEPEKATNKTQIL
jgi:hypothetical protein